MAFRATEEEEAVTIAVGYGSGSSPSQLRPTQTHQYDPVYMLPEGTKDHNCFQSKPHQSASNVTPEPRHPLQFKKGRE